MDFQTTPPQSWRPRLPYTFKSGNRAILRPVGLDLFAKLARIPDSLSGIVMDMFKGGGQKRFNLENLGEVKDLIVFLDQLCICAFAEPKVVEANPRYEMGEISVDDIPYGDKEEILDFFNDPSRALAPFRPQQSRDVEPVSQLQGEQDSPQPDAEDQRVGIGSVEFG